MTQTEHIKREAEEIARRTGQYIPPCRLASLMKAAQKITEYTATATFCMTYQECRIVLAIVESAISAVTREGQENYDA